MPDSPVVGSASFELRATTAKLQADVQAAQAKLDAAVKAMEATGKVEITGDAAPLIAASNAGAKAVEKAAQREVAASKAASAAVGTSVKEAAAKATSEHAKALSLIGGLSRTQAFELTHVGRSVFDGLASGANPIRILAQESGRLGQVLGEGSGGLSGSLKALGGIIFGPIGALGALAAALIATGVETLKFTEAQRDLGRVLDGGGRASGATVEGLESLAETSARAGNISTGAARGLEETYLRTGKIGVQTTKQLISITRDFAAVMGVDLKTAAHELATAFSDPEHGASKLNESLHFLTDAQREEIQAMQESGDRGAAQNLMFQALQHNVEGSAGKLNTLGGVMHSVATAFANATDEVGKFIFQYAQIPKAPTDAGTLGKRVADLKSQNPNAGFVPGSVFAGVSGFFHNLQLQTAQSQLAAAQRSARADDVAKTSESGGRAGDVIRDLNPDIPALRKLNEELATAKLGAESGFKGLKPDEIAKSARTIDGLTRAIKTYIPEQEKSERIAEIQAKLALRPGSAQRSKLQADLVRAQTDGDAKLTEADVERLVASGAERGANRGSFRDAAAERRKEQQAREEERKRVEALNRERTFTTSERAAQDQLSQAKEASTSEPAARADFQREKIEQDRQDKAREVSLQGPGKGGTGVLSQPQVTTLLNLNDQVAKQRDENVLSDERRRIGKETSDAEKSALESKLEQARAEQPLAKSTSQQRDIALRIFDLETQIETAKLLQVASNDKLSLTERETAVASLGALVARNKTTRQNVEKEHQSPGQAFQTSLNQSAGQINDGIQSIEVEGLKSFNDGLAEAIANSRDLGDVFHSIAVQILADLLKIGISQAITKPLAAAIFGPADPLENALAGIGLGGGGPSGGGGFLSFFSGLFGHADGGPIKGPGTGTSDSILARLSHGEFVVPASAASKPGNLALLEAMRSGLPGFADGGVVGGYSSAFTTRSSGAPSHAGRTGPVFDFRHALVTEDLLKYVNDQVSAGTTQAVGLSVAHTEQRVGQVQRSSARASRSDLTRY